MIEKVSKKVKFLAAVIGSLLITTVSAFGMYGVDGDDWIGFLTDGNQFRARMDQLGFTLGNGTIKGTFGFRNDKGTLGSIFSAIDNVPADFTPTVSAGLAYTSEAFGIGVGYNFTYLNQNLQIHTPVLMFNALNNNLRLAVPIEIAVTDKYLGTDNHKLTGVSFNNLELRYFTGIDAFNAIRVYFNYRNVTDDNSSKRVSETFGMQVRLYFLNTQVGNVTVNPFLRVEYHTALRGGSLHGYNMLDLGNGRVDGIADGVKQSDVYKYSPYQVTIKPVLSLAASSDIVSLYFEPSLGYQITGNAITVQEANAGMKQKLTHNLAWGAYAEMYVTPVEDLEWYFEMDINNTDVTLANNTHTPVYFETTTGITWYLPSFGGDTAQ